MRPRSTLFGHVRSRITLILALVVQMTLGARIGAETPPQIEAVFPANEASAVPLNTQIWIYGESLIYAAPEVSLTEKAGGEQVKCSVAQFEATDFSHVDKDREEPDGFVGDTGYRYVFLATPSVPLKAKTTYQLKCKSGSFSEWSGEFTTGEAADTEAPKSPAITNITHYTGGKSGKEARVYTVVEITGSEEKTDLPLRLEVVSATSDGGSKVETFIIADSSAKPWVAVIEGIPEGSLAVVGVDLSGNRSAAGLFLPSEKEDENWFDKLLELIGLD